MRCLILVVLMACKANIGADMDGGTADGSDDAPIDEMPDMAVGVGPWTNPVPLGITPMSDDDPTATGDLLELYFNRASDIYKTTRATTSDPWSTPVVVAELSSTSGETTPEVSYDGLTFYFASNRTGTTGGNDIWVSTRASRSDPWGVPAHVGALSSPQADGAPTAPDGLTMTLDSDRQQAGILDVYITTRSSASDTWGTPTLIPAVNSGGSSEGNPMLSTDKLTVYFDSNRTGDGELYAATRTSITAAFALPQRINELASTSADSDPWVSPDGRTLLFTSSRDGMQRLWQATR